MSFIPLDYNNFVVNKIKNKTKMQYEHANVLTHLSDGFFDSKSIINTNNFSNITYEEIKISDQDELKLNKKNAIEDFFNKVSLYDTFNYEENGDQKNYFVNIKDPISDLSLNNDNIKTYNFKNLETIKKSNQKFLIDCYEKNKINTVKSSLYKNYENNYSLDYYKELDIGFCNYNAINFFSISEQKKHSNCIIWPNLIKDNVNQYNILNDDSTISFRFNLRKEKDFTGYKPQCVIHIPDYLNVYFLRTDDVLNKYKICLVSGQRSREQFLELISELNLDLSNESEQILPQEGVYVSADLNIQENYWYNLSIAINKNRDQSNNKTVSCYIDESFAFIANNLSFEKRQEENHNSYICLGNKIKYQKDSENFTLDYSDIFYMLFGSRQNEALTSFGPYVNKDISYGKNFTWLDDGSKIIDNLDSQININIPNSDQLYCESFEGELHDIRIYSISLSENKINFNAYNSIENIKNEILNYNLEFYVPVYYINSYLNKKSILNLNNNSIDNMHFSCLYNPYFANSCGGLEISSSNYLVDFVNYTKPNIVIDGYKQNNFYKNDYLYSQNIAINNFDKVVLDMKKGRYLNNIYYDIYSAEDFENLDGGLIYNNLLILPNDDGKISINFSVIKEFLEEIYPSDLYSVNSFFKNHNVPVIDIFKNTKNEFYYPFCNNQPAYEFCALTGDDLDDISINIDLDGETEVFEFSLTQDKFYNLSNILYHEKEVSWDSLNNKFSFENCSDDIKRQNDDVVNFNADMFLEFSPVLRSYFSDINSLNYPINIISSKEFLINNTLNKVNYINYPMGYSNYNNSFDCMFTSIFDISNKFYSSKIEKGSYEIKDENILNGALKLNFKDDENGSLYRNNCLSKVATWNYVGNIFYKEGVSTFFRPELSYFGINNFSCSFDSIRNMFVHEINIQAKSGFYNKSFNSSYNNNLRQDENSLNSESSFVYVSDINLHDENFNIIAKAKMARPAPKKLEDNILFRLKMDY